MEKTISSDFIRGHIDTIILKSLFDGSKHALEISQYIEEKSGNQYEVKQATLYSALKRLETKKFVRPFWNDAPEGGRRRYFEATQAGLDYANKTLSEWDFSRDIIDTLIDETPNNKIHSPTSEINKNKKSNLDALSENKQITEPIIIVQNSLDIQNSTQSEQQKQIIVEKQVVDVNEVQRNNIKTTQNEPIVEHKNKFDEINYKKILGDLFNLVQQPSEKLDEETPKDVKSEDIEQKSPIIETTLDDDLLTKPQKTGNTDFSDLIEKAKEEGYKIRISSNKTEKIGGKILINKANLTTSLFVFLISLIEVLIVSLICKNGNVLNPIWYFATIAFFAIYPIISIICYVKNPLKTISKYNVSNIQTATIICINAILFIFAIALLTDVQFSNVFSVITQIVIPLIVVFNVFLWFFTKHFIVKNKNFITK